MIEQVVGKIADPDAGSRIVDRRHRHGCGVCIRDEPSAPIAVDREERFGIGMRVEGHVEAKPGNGAEIVELCSMGKSQTVQGNLGVAARDVDIGQVVQRVAMRRCGRQAFAQGGFCRFVLSCPVLSS